MGREGKSPRVSVPKVYVGEDGLEKLRKKLTRAQTMGPGDFMQNKQGESSQRDTIFFTLA